MKVFITGATGYIGFNAACALRRAGHDVFGLVRSEAKASVLERHEIHPVKGTLQTPESFRAAAEQCAVLIHAAADTQADTVLLDRTTLETLIAAGDIGARRRP